MSGMATNSTSLPRIEFPRRPVMSAKQKRFIWSLPLVGACAVFAGAAGDWIHHDKLSQQLHQIPTSSEAPSAQHAAQHIQPIGWNSITSQPVTPAPAQHGPEQGPERVHAITWAPQREHVERTPSDHPAVAGHDAIRVKVVTIRARVTAYTPYDHALSKPEWADGIVAWHPNGKQRSVEQHRYGLATDWGQFPPGATYIRIPGYMEKSFPNFPENFRVVDDACGQSRRARRNGEQPVIDVRFMTRFSAIDPKQGWGSQQLEVEVIYPEDFVIPRDLQKWVSTVAWHTYSGGKLIRVEKL